MIKNVMTIKKDLDFLTHRYESINIGRKLLLHNELNNLRLVEGGSIYAQMENNIDMVEQLQNNG